MQFPNTVLKAYFSETLDYYKLSPDNTLAQNKFHLRQLLNCKPKPMRIIAYWNQGGEGKLTYDTTCFFSVLVNAVSVMC